MLDTPANNAHNWLIIYLLFSLCEKIKACPCLNVGLQSITYSLQITDFDIFKMYLYYYSFAFIFAPNKKRLNQHILMGYTQPLPIVGRGILSPQYLIFLRVHLETHFTRSIYRLHVGLLFIYLFNQNSFVPISHCYIIYVCFNIFPKQLWHMPCYKMRINKTFVLFWKLDARVFWGLLNQQCVCMCKTN